MRLISFDPDAFQQFSIWATDDKKLFERRKRIISETAEDLSWESGSRNRCARTYVVIGSEGSAMNTAWFIKLPMNK